MKKGMKAPDFSGVKGELVLAEGLQLNFGSRLKSSPYDALLDQLVAARGQLLKFAALKARASVAVRAKKKGLRVSFAEAGGCLFVRYDGLLVDDVKGTRRAKILDVLEKMPRNAAQLAVALREAGDSTVDASLVLAILAQLERDGQVVRGEGDRWAKSPRALKRAV